MTLEAFCTALTACADDITWHHWSPVLRGHLRYGTSGALVECCPLTAVAYAQTGVCWSLNAPDAVATALALSVADADAIIAAADGTLPGEHLALRARLRACIGLPEEKDHSHDL